MAIGFGVRLPISGPLAVPDNVRDAAVWAEDLGFDSVWVHDFLIWTKMQDRIHVSSGAIELIQDDTEPWVLESLTTLAYVAGATKRVKIGTAVMALPYRDPVVTAKQISTLDHLSKGRMIFGYGIGGRYTLDYEYLPTPMKHRKEFFQRSREVLAAMLELWTEPEPRYSGNYYRFAPTTMYPKPTQQPLPLWFGGKGPMALKLAAELAHGWLPTWLVPAKYEELLPVIEGHLKERGRSLEGFTIGKECYTVIAETDNAVRDIAQRTMATFSSGFTVQSEADAWESSLVGMPSDVITKIQRFIDVGVTYFEMKFIYRSMAELRAQLELFAREVIPAFNS
ncbi:MAG: LLM class flavin-dependent oxidoreductase [Chloroflexi bacterium]|nr:LLM class flavin-dependent oxidoreductase [Chloroflexota bacterium]